jgi:hypothetical protein
VITPGRVLDVVAHGEFSEHDVVLGHEPNHSPEVFDVANLALQHNKKQAATTTTTTTTTNSRAQ